MGDIDTYDDASAQATCQLLKIMYSELTGQGSELIESTTNTNVFSFIKKDTATLEAVGVNEEIEDVTVTSSVFQPPLGTYAYHQWIHCILMTISVNHQHTSSSLSSSNSSSVLHRA